MSAKITERRFVEKTATYTEEDICELVRKDCGAPHGTPVQIRGHHFGVDEVSVKFTVEEE